MTPIAVIGIDAGGTKTAGVLATPDGAVLGRSLGGPANYQSVGRVGARRSLVDVLAPLLDVAAREGRHVAAVAYGLSGLDRPRDEEALAPEIARVTPDDAVPIAVNDTFLILRAGTPDGVGVAVVSGTGPNTVGWGPSGAEARVGGIAGELGDVGGGGDIGLEAIKAARRGADGRARPTALHDLILDALDIEDITDIVDFYLADSLGTLQPSKLAPLVFQAARAGDPVAADILAWAGGELGLAARLVAEKLFEPGDTFPLVMGGSVLQRGEVPLMRDRIFAEVNAAFPNVRPQVLTAEPVCGGVLLALDRVAGLRGGPPLREGGAPLLRTWPDAAVQARLVQELRLDSHREDSNDTEE